MKYSQISTPLSATTIVTAKLTGTGTRSYMLVVKLNRYKFKKVKG